MVGGFRRDNCIKNAGDNDIAFAAPPGASQPICYARVCTRDITFLLIGFEKFGGFRKQEKANALFIFCYTFLHNYTCFVVKNERFLSLCNNNEKDLIF